MKRIIVIVLILMTSLTAGCWDQREINELALVVASAVDLETKNDKDLVRITMQIANPVALVPGGSGGEGSAKAFWTVAGVGETIRIARANVAGRIPKTGFLGQSRVYIIGEKAAKKGVAPLLDAPFRTWQVRDSTFLAISEEEAKKILELEMPTFRATGLAISTMFQNKTGIDHVMPVTLNDFAYRLSTGTMNPIAPIIRTVPQSSVTSEDLKKGPVPKTIEVKNMAVFDNNGKLLAFLNTQETDGLLWTINQGMRRHVVVPCPEEGPDEPLVLVTRRSNCKIKVKLDKQGMPEFLLDIRTICDLEEHFGEHPGMLSLQYVNSLERRVNTKIEQDIEAALNRCKQLDADVFGFGEEVRRQKHEVWPQVMPVWKDIFPQIKVTIKCRTSFRHRGLSVEAPGARREGV